MGRDGGNGAVPFCRKTAHNPIQIVVSTAVGRKVTKTAPRCSALNLYIRSEPFSASVRPESMGFSRPPAHGWVLRRELLVDLQKQLHVYSRMTGVLMQETFKVASYDEARPGFSCRAINKPYFSFSVRPRLARL